MATTMGAVSDRKRWVRVAEEKHAASVLWSTGERKQGKFERSSVAALPTRRGWQPACLAPSAAPEPLPDVPIDSLVQSGMLLSDWS